MNHTSSSALTTRELHRGPCSAIFMPGLQSLTRAQSIKNGFPFMISACVLVCNVIPASVDVLLRVWVCAFMCCMHACMHV